MDVILEHAEQLVLAVLRRFGPHGPGWAVLDARYHHGQSLTDEPPANALEPVDVVLVRLCAPPRCTRPIGGVYFLLSLPLEPATVATADQLQDLALEAVGGAPLPPCPGHRHPLVAREVDGRARWVGVPGQSEPPPRGDLYRQLTPAVISSALPAPSRTIERPDIRPGYRLGDRWARYG